MFVLLLNGYTRKNFEQLAESSKVSRFGKEEFEEYQKVYHQEYDHNAMVPSIFKEFASEINAKIDERVSENTREMAKNSRPKGFP